VKFTNRSAGLRIIKMSREDSSDQERPPIPPGIASLHDELVDAWGKVQELREKNLYDALPEICRTECTIAKLVIQRVMEDGTKGLWVREKLGECPAAPQVTGNCSTQRNVCSHPESGKTDNFVRQVNNLYSYVQEDEISL
jgi:hypothetical protein